MTEKSNLSFSFRVHSFFHTSNFFFLYYIIMYIFICCFLLLHFYDLFLGTTIIKNPNNLAGKSLLN